MEVKQYIGNLPYTRTLNERKSLFEQAGTVESVDIIIDRMTAKYTSFGLIKMNSESEPEKAIALFTEHKLENRNLLVTIARCKAETVPGKGYNFVKAIDGFGRGGLGTNRVSGPGRI